MADGGQSSEGANLSRIIQNFAQIEMQRADAYRNPKIPKFFREDPVVLAVGALTDTVTFINVLVKVLENIPSRALGKLFHPRKTSHAYSNGDHRHRPFRFQASPHSGHIVGLDLFGRHRLGYISASCGRQGAQAEP